MPLKNQNNRFAQSVAIEVAAGRGSFVPTQPVVAAAPLGLTSALNASWVVSSLTQTRVTFTLPAITSTHTTTVVQSIPLGSSFPNPLSLLPTDSGVISAYGVLQESIGGLICSAILTNVVFGSVIGPNAMFQNAAWTTLTPGLSYRNGQVNVSFQIANLSGGNYAGGDEFDVAVTVVLYGQTGTS